MNYDFDLLFIDIGKRLQKSSSSTQEAYMKLVFAFETLDSLYHSCNRSFENNKLLKNTPNRFDVCDFERGGPHSAYYSMFLIKNPMLSGKLTRGTRNRVR